MALGSVEVGSAAMRRLAVRRLAALAAVALAALPACGGRQHASGDKALFCARLDRLTRNDPFLGFGDTASADDIEVAFGALVDRSDELVDVAPPEARPAARDYADAAKALNALLADASYLPKGVDTRAYRDEQIAYVEASQRLERYLRAEC